MSESWTPRGLKQVIFVGGGRLLTACASKAMQFGLEVGFLVSTRHAEEEVVGTQSLRDWLEHSGAGFSIIQSTSELEKAFAAKVKEGSLLVGVGPSWILSDQIIESFDVGAINVNAIPVPQYLGGAHFTWQIMNGSLAAGICIQEMNSEVDRGDVLFSKSFEIPPTARVPQDYFDEYEVQIGPFFSDFLERVLRSAKFSRTPWSELEGNRLYFPRLSTALDGFIDWGWDVADIVRFCNSFDEPYAGAGTFLGSRELRLKGVSEYQPDFPHDFHPFSSGLVVRRSSDGYILAAKGGLIRVRSVLENFEEAQLREGEKLFTPLERLVPKP